MDKSHLGVRIWGAVGSFPHMGEDQVRYGGNTTSLEILYGGSTPLYIDAGTGIANAGQTVMKQKPGVRDLHILFTHYHWDHTAGLPFFVPIYQSRYSIHLHGPGADSGALREMLDLTFSPEFSPIYGIGNLKSKLAIEPERSFIELEGLSVSVLDLPLGHPGGVRCYRFEQGGESFVFATDVEMQNQGVSPALADFCRGADFLILDAQYTAGEYCRSKRGWGHSTYEDALAVTRAAGVKRLCFFHLEPLRPDSGHERLLERFRQENPDLRLVLPETGGEFYCVE